MEVDPVVGTLVVQREEAVGALKDIVRVLVTIWSPRVACNEGLREYMAGALQIIDDSLLQAADSAPEPPGRAASVAALTLPRPETARVKLRPLPVDGKLRGVLGPTTKKSTERARVWETILPATGDRDRITARHPPGTLEAGIPILRMLVSDTHNVPPVPVDENRARVEADPEHSRSLAATVTASAAVLGPFVPTKEDSSGSNEPKLRVPEKVGVRAAKETVSARDCPTGDLKLAEAAIFKETEVNENQARADAAVPRGETRNAEVTSEVENDIPAIVTLVLPVAGPFSVTREDTQGDTKDTRAKEVPGE